MTDFLRLWFVGITRPSVAFQLLRRRPAPGWGLISTLVRFVGTSITSILALRLISFKPFVPSYLTFLSDSDYYQAEIFFLPFFGVGVWLLSSALVHLILRISAQESNIDWIMNVIGFSLLVVMPVVWLLDWGGIVFDFYGASFTIPIHAAVSIWEVILIGVGLKSAGNLSWVAALILGLVVKAGIYIPLAAVFVRQVKVIADKIPQEAIALKDPIQSSWRNALRERPGMLTEQHVTLIYSDVRALEEGANPVYSARNRQTRRYEEKVMQYKRTRLLQLIILVCLLVFVDQAIRAIVRTTLNPGSSISIIGDTLQITFVQNFKGFSWFVPALPSWTKSVFRVVLILIVLLAFPVYVFYTQTRRQSMWTNIAVMGIAASCLGHLIDDLFLPYTTDFIQVFHWPSANLADVYAYAGIVALAVETVFTFRARKSNGKGFRHLLARAVRTRQAFVEFIIRGFRF